LNNKGVSFLAVWIAFGLKYGFQKCICISRFSKTIFGTHINDVEDEKGNREQALI